MPTRSVISDMAVYGETPQALCREVGAELKASLPWEGLTLRPWDGSAPESCLWWAVPSPEWPSFHLAKLFVDWLHPDDHSDLLCGIHIEKGLDVAPEGFDANASTLTMDARWAWHSLMRDLSDGRIGQLAQAVTSPTAPSLYLRIEASDSIKLREPFPRARELWRGGVYYGFECRGSDGTLRLLYTHDDRRLASSLKQPRTLQQLAGVLDEMPDAGRLWFDLQLGLAIRVWGPEVSCDVISAKELVARHVVPLARWMIKSSLASSGLERKG